MSQETSGSQENSGSRENGRSSAASASPLASASALASAEPAHARAAAAVVAHHAALAADLNRLVEGVIEAAERSDARTVWLARAALVTWLNTELIPHATAEERALYPAAAETMAGKLLVDGMVDEHRTILGLVDELAAASTPVRAAGAARALAAVFGTHLTKENELILPLIIETGDASLAALLDGMHALLGGHGGHDAHGAHGAHGDSAGSAEPGGCGGACGCGGDAAGQDTAEAAVLTIDPRLDVRDIPHDRRHATVLAALEAVPAGGALVLVAPHAPRPLLAEIAARHPGQFSLDWLQNGPSVWQLRLQRAPAPV